MRSDERGSTQEAVRRADFTESLRLRRRLGRMAYLRALLAGSNSDDDTTGRRATATVGDWRGKFAQGTLLQAR